MRSTVVCVLLFNFMRRTFTELETKDIRLGKFKFCSYFVWCATTTTTTTNNRVIYSRSNVTLSVASCVSVHNETTQSKCYVVLVRASDRVQQNLGNCAAFSSQIVRHKRPIVRQKWSIMRQIVRFFRVILILFPQVLEEKNHFFAVYQ